MGYVSTTTYMHTYYWYPKCNFQYSYLRFYGTDLHETFTVFRYICPNDRCKFS